MSDIVEYLGWKWRRLRPSSRIPLELVGDILGNEGETSSGYKRNWRKRNVPRKKGVEAGLVDGTKGTKGRNSGDVESQRKKLSRSVGSFLVDFSGTAWALLASVRCRVTGSKEVAVTPLRHCTLVVGWERKKGGGAERREERGDSRIGKWVFSAARFHQLENEEEGGRENWSVGLAAGALRGRGETLYNWKASLKWKRFSLYAARHRGKVRGRRRAESRTVGTGLRRINEFIKGMSRFCRQPRAPPSISFRPHPKTRRFASETFTASREIFCYTPLHPYFVLSSVLDME